MKTIKARVGWTTRHVTYLDMDVPLEFDGTFTEEQKQDAIASKDYQAEDWIDEESYDYTVEVAET